VTIKAKVEKCIKVGFVYPVQLIEWVSKLVPVKEKKGTIRVCMEFCYLNKDFLKDNFPTPFIDKIFNGCAGFEVFYFMDVFS
jgi:hypothetical protein